MQEKRPSYFRGVARIQLRWVFLMIGFISATLGSLSTAPLQAQALPASASFSQVAQFGNTSNLSSGYGANVSSCEIETVGWVICPVMRSIAKLADYGFAFINQNFLKIEYGISNSDSGVYKAWEIMRNVANALFVLAFMGIVYAQITGRSAGGYNIKRMLPRLILGAIFVNISYYACVIGIEISNILGGSILAIMQGVTDSIGPAAMTLSSAQNGFDDSRLSDITSGILTKTDTVWILLAPVAAVTVSIALICAAGLVLLIVRKVVVAMLVLVSPLMFVTYLLPNTEHYFQKWLRLFFQLLLLYPVVAFLLGTGQIISATIVNVGTGTDSNYQVRGDSYTARNGGSGSATTDLAAAGAAVLPLLGTWFLLKSLSSFATNASTKVASSVSRRGSKKEEQKLKAQLDGKAKQSIAGSGLPTYDRKPAFSRLRRRRGTAALADGIPTKAPTVKPSAAGTSTPSLFDRATGNINEKQNTQPEAPNPLALNNSARQGELDPANLNDEATLQAAAAIEKDDKKDKTTAKDLFNNLNKTHEMDHKKQPGNKEASASTTNEAGTAPQPGPMAQPQAPIDLSNLSGASASVSPAATQSQAIAVPIEVIDASAFLKKDTSQESTPPSHLPTSEIENKAKNRANKYLFESQKDVTSASDRIEELKAIRIQQQKDEANKEPR